MKLPLILTMAGAASASLSLFLGLFVFFRRSSAPGSKPFALMMAANALYAAAYTIELNAPDLAATVSWLRVEHYGVTLVPPLWLIFADALADRSLFRTAARRLSLFALPAATLAIVSSDRFIGFMYTGFRLAEVPGLSVIVASRGPWYWINAAYLYGLLLLGAVGVGRVLFRSDGLFRTQSIVIGLGLLFPWIGHFFLIIRKGPFSLDPTPFALTATGACMVVGLFKLGLFDLVPIARERVFDAIRDGVVVVDRRGRFVDANRAAKTVFPALRTIEPGKNAVPFLESIPLDIDSMNGALDLSLLVDGAVRHFRMDARPIENRRGDSIGTAIIVADTTESTELLSRMAKLATTDELTGAYNRRHFLELAEREMEMARRKSRPVSFAMFDLDHFKKVNDRYGHPAGDAALKSVCAVCRSLLRSTDLLCRYGGEEFVLLFPETGPLDAKDIAERLRERIKRTTVETGERSFSVTASFGVCGSDGTTMEALNSYLSRSDEAMYRAKAEGRNRVALCTAKSLAPEGE